MISAKVTRGRLRSQKGHTATARTFFTGLLSILILVIFKSFYQGCGSALIFCGSGSSCLINADQDPAQAKKITI